MGNINTVVIQWLLGGGLLPARLPLLRRSVGLEAER